MSNPIDSLEPREVWHYFDRIRQIPHGSGNEKAIGEAIMAWAAEKGREADMDAVGNVVVRVPASPGLERAKGVVLQGHMDMVCEKNADKAFDFTKDAIQLVRRGDWLTADGTTLGADNGLGLATALAFMDLPGAIHGPLEILATVDEERGLVGARNVGPDFVKGRLLFNVDSEEDGVFYIGCAGGRDSEIALPLRTLPAPEGMRSLRIEIKGLRGGHSGLDIVHNRGNALRLLARALRAASRKATIILASIDGGDKHNAIPREAFAIALIKPESEVLLREILAEQLAGFREEFAGAEPELALVAAPTAIPPRVMDPAARDNALLPPRVMDPAARDNALRLILGLPHGVLAMMRDIPGKVETSSNLARVRTESDRLEVLCSSRSSIGSALEGVIAQIESVGQALGAQVKLHEGYPGWKPNLESPMLAKARDVWRAVHGADAKFEVVHAGLECGIIGERYPGMDMISLGPTIENPHSPDERTHIPAVGRFFEFVKAFLAALARA
jgi:dipeptidase D